MGGLWNFLQENATKKRGEKSPLFYYLENLISFETDSLTLTSLDQAPLEFFGDGETFEPVQSLKIGLTPGALEACTYQGESLLCTSYPLDKIEMIQ